MYPLKPFISNILLKQENTFINRENLSLNDSNEKYV